MKASKGKRVRTAGKVLQSTTAGWLPQIAFAASPFATGATASQTEILTILTPIAVIAVMVAGIMAWFGKISWWWLVGVVIGIVLVFGAPQIVAWIRGMFGV